MAEWRKLEGVERELLFDGLEDLGRGVNHRIVFEIGRASCRERV